MQHRYRTEGTCSREIVFDLEEGKIVSCEIVGGCPGNRQAVARLAIGRPAEEVVRLCKGIRCGAKPTSCPDQLARALEAALAGESA